MRKVLLHIKAHQKRVRLSLPMEDPSAYVTIGTYKKNIKSIKIPTPYGREWQEVIKNTELTPHDNLNMPVTRAQHCHANPLANALGPAVNQPALRRSQCILQRAANAVEPAPAPQPIQPPPPPPPQA